MMQEFETIEEMLIGLMIDLTDEANEGIKCLLNAAWDMMRVCHTLNGVDCAAVRQVKDFCEMAMAALEGN